MGRVGLRGSRGGQRRADGAPSLLRFDSLAKLDASTAEALANQKGILVLNGLTALAPEAGAALSKHEGTLVLNGLLELPPDVATALAPCPSALISKAVTQLSPAAATALAKHQAAWISPAVLPSRTNRAPPCEATPKSGSRKRFRIVAAAALDGSDT